MNAAAGLWWLSCLPEAARFWRAADRPREAQERVLQGILQRAAGSEFGRRHRFAGLSHPDDFRASVPLSSYDDYREDIARIATGEPNVLTSERVRLLEPTSGSGGGAKLIPYTAGLKAEFQRGIAPWIANLLGSRPGLMGGRHYWSISPPAVVSPPAQGGVPIGFEDDTEYLSGISGWLVRNLMAVPNSVVREPDYQRATLRALLACPDLAMVSVWSPTFWLLLMERLPEFTARHPAEIWPGLRCLSCWGDGFSAGYLGELQTLHPGLWIQKKGLIATEAFCTFPLVGREGAALSLRSHFYEFLEGERSFLAHELQLGRTYEIAVTTGGGLYRYRLGDRVRVCGFWRACPLLVFEGRLGVVDRFGEKLCEADLLEIRQETRFCMVAYESAQRAYALFTEGSPERAESLEAGLRERNFHYRNCRELGQLNALLAYSLEPGAMQRYCAHLQAQGMRAGDIKAQALRGEENWSRILPGRFIPLR